MKKLLKTLLLACAVAAGAAQAAFPERTITLVVPYAPGGAAKLSEALRRRFNYVVADLPFTGQPFQRDLLHLAHQRVLVMVLWAVVLMQWDYSTNLLKNHLCG